MTATVNERMSFKNNIPLSESFARKVLDASLNGIYVYDVTLGKNIFINSRYTKITGYTIADLNKLSKTQFFDLFHIEDRGLVNEHMEKLFLTGDENLEIEYRFKTKDGRWIWCLSLDSVFYRDHYGSVSHFVGTFLDITNRKESERTLRESENRYKELVQNANSAIIRWRCDGSISFFNEYAQSFFGYSSEEVIGRKVSILLPQCDSEGDDLTGLVQDIVENPQDYIKNINENICRDGRRVWMAWTNKAILDQYGKVVEIFAVGSDVSEQKRMEEALKKSNQELTEYSYALTHNLKAPLRAVRNYVDFLLEDLGDTLEGEPKKYLDGIKEAVTQSSEQFRDLETLYKIKNHPVKFELIEMKGLCDEILSQLKHNGEGQLNLAEQFPVIRGERFLLRQILYNLISNGFKFNHSAVKNVEVGWQQMTENEIVIFVRDNGIGIEPRYHKQIFRIFQRLHTDTEFKGTGVGLAIVKRAADKIGGVLRVESKVGEGSTFYITLPISILEENR
jgi:PAS domain S-box-containing protein